MATTLNNLGNLYSNTTRFTEAEKAYVEALEIYRQLAATNLSAYLPDVANTLNNLGILNINHKKYADALSNFREALSIREKLVVISPPAFDLDLCQTILSMAFLYTIAPDDCAELKGEIPSLLNRAITILKKYPDNPQAQKYLDVVGQLKKEIK
ncbi:MAG: tetratricopeptide repeat protein [Candidatus Aminicenantes bacterium]|nr:tetratricopeptide repeat protein [Candidatus Aminicenantes bacterium]